MGNVNEKVKARSNGQCEVYLPEYHESFERLFIRRCLRKATEIHHLKYRSRGGTDSLDNLLHVCKVCHDRAGDSSDLWFSRYRAHRWQNNGVREIDGQNLISNMVLSIKGFEQKVLTARFIVAKQAVFILDCKKCGFFDFRGFKIGEKSVGVFDRCPTCYDMVELKNVTEQFRSYEKGIEEIKFAYKM